MKTSWKVFCRIPIITLMLACQHPEVLVPEDPLSPPPREPLPQLVVVEQEMIYAPAPRDNGIAPEACDYISFLRYRPETADGTPKEVNAILVLIPGNLGGANVFDYLGRQLVAMAEAMGNGSLEVWALDRRPNCLEDLTGMLAAEREGDPEIAVNYYFFGASVDNREFEGFLGDNKVPFLSEFGLRLLMEDIYTVITTKIPEQEDRNNTVFIGGHSLGAPLAAIFAGWDFDGDPVTLKDAGYQNCAGLIGLDGSLISPSQGIDETAYTRSIAAIRSGNAARVNLYPGLNQEALVLLELLGMAAFYAPDEESNLLREIPYTKEVEQLIRFLQSRNRRHFISGVPKVTDLRYTNEAMLGIFIDDNFQPVTILQASLGFLGGGLVVKKEFPGNPAELFGAGLFIDTDGLFIAWDTGSALDPGSGPLYSWVNFDRIGNAADPDFKDSRGTLTYTTMLEEVTDIRGFAQLLFQGPTNFTEWYSASRLPLDLLAVASPFNADYGLSLFHQDKGQAKTSIEFLAADIPGYNHLDVLCAAVDRPSHRENEVFEPLIEFVFSHSGGTVVPID